MVAQDRIRVVTSPVRQGRYAYRFEVHQGDSPPNSNSSNDRAELGQGNPGNGPRINEGSEQWYGMSYYFDQSFPKATWQTVAQWKQMGSNPPPAEISVNNDVIALEMGGTHGDREKLYRAPLTRGVWNDFVMHVKWSADPNVGFVEFWHNGRQVVRKTSIQNMYRDESGKVIQNHSRIGYYRDQSITQSGVLYIDAYRVGTSYAAVAP